MIKIVTKFIKLSLKDKYLLIKTYLISFKIRFLIKFLPFKKYVHMLGKENYESKNQEIDINFIKKHIINIRRVSKYSFWRTKCFEEAFTLKILLKQDNIETTIYFGLAKDKENNILQAHAWLKLGNIVLIGGNGHKKYVITKYFT